MHVLLQWAEPLPIEVAQWLLQLGLDKKLGAPTIVKTESMSADEYLLELSSSDFGHPHGGYIYICHEGAIRISAGYDLTAPEFLEQSSISDIRLGLRSAMKKQARQERLDKWVSEAPYNIIALLLIGLWLFLPLILHFWWRDY